MSTYLFDFDGTLVDSMPTYVGVMKRILDENGITYGDDLMKMITPLGYVGTAKYYHDVLKVPLEVDAMIESMHQYATAEYVNNIQAKSNVIEAVKALKARGDDLHILTASPHTALDPCLKRLGILELFGNVWSCEDFGTTKADVNIYRMAAERIGKPVEDIIFLDDNYNADKTAIASGMTVYGVYDDSSAEYEDEMRRLCHRYIKDFSELL